MSHSPFIDIVVRSCVRVRRSFAVHPPESRPLSIRKCRGSGRILTQPRRHDWSNEHCANEPFGFLASAWKSALVIGLLAFVLPAAAAVREVGAIELTVNDLNSELKFFTNTLPFQLRSLTATKRGAADELLALNGTELRTAELTLGDERIRLTEHLRHKGRAIPADSRSFDHWFQHIAIVVRDMDAAYEHLRGAKVKHVSTGPQTLPAWNKDAGGIKAFYFRDPEDHVLEVIWFPPGKGDPKWQQSTTNLFLGIDHTAIVVSDTDKSLAFYTNVLGMRVVGGAENYGVEQEHLNQVFGARLRITALRAERGPGIEFLEYITPPGGRPLPGDAKANDLIFWQTWLHMDALNLLEQRLQSSGTHFVSRGKDAGQQIVRDPDGHALRLVATPATQLR
jgi:catechol 2,3-dioxygenase-like lactoylglutathione lyase family enzyme